MRCLFLLLLLALGLVPSARACPDLTGRYRIGYGTFLEPTAYRGIVTALRVTGGPGGVLDLEISSSSDGRTMAVGLLASPTERQQPQPHAKLSFGADYDCKDGVVSLLAPFDDTRKSDNDYLEGTTVVSMRRGSGGGLAFALQFTGVQRLDLYSYESARIRVPLPLTRRRLVEKAELMPADLAPPPPPPPNPAKLARERAEERTVDTLRSKVISLTGALIGVIKTETEGMRLQLIASSSEQMLRIEDSLLTSDLPYEVVTEPYWDGRSWVVSILVRSARAGSVRRPSAFRVEKELEKLLCRTNTKGSYVVKTKRNGEDYEARVALLGGMTAAEAADCLTRRGSNLISQTLPVGTELQYFGDGDKRELSVWRVTVWR